MSIEDDQEPKDEVLGDYDSDPRSGDEFVPIPGQALGPQDPPEHIPEDNLREGERFSFSDPETIEQFEQAVIRRQVPGYDLMRLRVLQLGYRFLAPNTAVLDLGTSRAKTIRDLIQVAHERGLPGANPGTRNDVTYVGVDLEQDMLDAARVSVDKLAEDLGIAQHQAHQGVILRQHDLRTSVIPAATEFGDGYSLVVSNLTLQFVPVVYRQQIVRDIYKNLAPGGAFILVEKVVGNSAITDDLLVEAYHDHKRRRGISEEAISRKRASIESYLVPHRSDENRHMLIQAGFLPYQVETFWRDLNFEAVIAIKE